MVFCRGKLAENALRNSHRCHRFSQMLLLGKNLPQNTRISQNLLLRIFSHRFHSAQMLTSGVHLSPLGFAACQSKKCTNRAILIYLLLRVRLYDMYCCLLRRLSPPLRMGAHPNNLCRSVKSVGEYHSKKVLWVLWILWEEITVRRFCEYQWNLWEKITVRRFCADLWNLWENITARRFCEFCEICGKKTACLVGAAETAAPPES